jgi:hypothetical protein
VSQTSSHKRLRVRRSREAQPRLNAYVKHRSSAMPHADVPAKRVKRARAGIHTPRPDLGKERRHRQRASTTFRGYGPLRSQGRQQKCRGSTSSVLKSVPDGQSAHERHAQIARRVSLSQGRALAPSGKSAPDFRTSRLGKRGVSRSSRHARWDAMDATSPQRASMIRSRRPRSAKCVAVFRSGHAQLRHADERAECGRRNRVVLTSRC